MSPDNNDIKAVCSVTELAKKLGLSRVRFYQLLETGVFPRPIYYTHTKRPFYPLELQQKCIDIRKTGIGYNGEPVIFYTAQKSKFRKPQNGSQDKYNELTDILRQMGLNVTVRKVKDAIKILYPEKLTLRSIEGTVIRDSFRYFERKV